MPRALARVAHASRFPLVATATAAAHAHAGRAAVTRKAGRPRPRSYLSLVVRKRRIASRGNMTLFVSRSCPNPIFVTIEL